ncbi:tetratricopeptide repeat protein [Roseovarius arcticus]|uniref:tetratricopeptide repeat protein n=1 Tax=Roseovarius arcticus TaxID=2547404 RepID=UPI0014871339|nr:tetratricopeptide repeat protein [Roseovarius arcticus]
MSTVETKKRGHFICLRRDQLGARLLMILNCIRLSEDFGFDYLINWFPRNAAAPKLANPDELFSQDYMDRHFISNDEYEAMRDGAQPLHAFFQDKTPDRLLKHLNGGNHILLEEGFEVAVFQWENEEQIADRYRGFIKKIELNSLVASKMAEIDQAVGPSSAGSVSYHVRRGDILNEDPWKHGMWPAKIEPDELYLKHLEIGQPQMALVFSDLDESIERLQKEHPNVRGIKGLITVSDCTPCQQDFLELYAMSRTEKIVAPVISAFSSAAARLSGRDRRRFVDVLEPAQINDAYDRVADRFRGGLHNFVNLSEAAHVFSRLSRHLAMNDREQEGYDIGKSLLEAGTDNAFLPLLHAVNCIYLSQWQEAKINLDKAMSAPGLWKEDYASAMALLSHVNAALGDPIGARRLWLRAFWAKPHLPDVIVAGSALMERHRLKSGPDLTFDIKLLRSQRLPYIQRDILTVQRKMIKRKPVDFSLLTIEWRSLVLDRKAKRLLMDQKILKRIRTLVAQTSPDPGFDSFRGLLQHYVGRSKAARALTAEAIEAAPEDFLVNKRRAEVLWAANQPVRAIRHMRKLTELEPSNPFGHFMLARCLEQNEKPAEALHHYREAASLDCSTPAIHAALANCLSDQGQFDPAIEAFATASALAPTFQKFSNQGERLARKLANSG